LYGGGLQLELFNVSESFKIVSNVARKMDG
jgi:hypothetical protein